LKKNGRLPLRITLSEVKNLNKAVEEFLLNHGCDQEGIDEIKNESVIILFDGYDEINQSINLYKANKLEAWKDVKVIFTSRKENLTSMKEDYTIYFTPGDEKTERDKLLSYTLCPLSRVQITKYFNAQTDENKQKKLTS